MSDETKVWHAFYSREQEEHLNRKGLTANFYLDSDGNEVRITEVSRNNVSTSKWKDLVYLGIVVKWSRVAEPIIDHAEYEIARQLRLRKKRELRSERYINM